MTAPGYARYGSAWSPESGWLRRPQGRSTADCVFSITGSSSASAVSCLFAVALLTTGVNRPIGMGWLPALIDPLWDTSALLDDGSAAGTMLSAFTGYRAHPSLMLAAVYAAYWITIMLVQRRLPRNE